MSSLGRKRPKTLLIWAKKKRKETLWIFELFLGFPFFLEEREKTAVDLCFFLFSGVHGVFEALKGDHPLTQTWERLQATEREAKSSSPWQGFLVSGLCCMLVVEHG